MTRQSRAVLVAASLLAGCAETNAPLPDPVEVLLVVNRVGNTLSIVPVDAPDTHVEVPLGVPGAAPSTLAARNDIALVPLGPGDGVAVVDLRQRVVSRIVSLPGSGATGAAILDDSIAYVASPNLNSVFRLNYVSGELAEVSTGRSSQGVVFTRGRVYVVNGNLASPGQPLGESWITVIDPATNSLASGIDSIPLTGPGNASSGVAGGDGLLYVVVTGSTLEGEGRLSIVDPVERVELASFAGLGRAPGQVATDGEAHVFVSSSAEGLLAFDTDSNKVVRGAGEGVAVPGNTGVAVDSRRRVYAIEPGACSGGAAGLVRVLSEDLEEELRSVPLGECPAAALTVRIPPE